MKIISRIIPLFIVLVLLSACGQRNLATDKPLDDGSYFYRNNALNFSMILPASFEYYQTQRTKGDHYVDVEFFVPTSDTRFGKQVQGYAKPITVRVFEKIAWDNIDQEDSDYKYLGEKNGQVYTIDFWEEEPRDWLNKWNGNIENSIIDNFAIE